VSVRSEKTLGNLKLQKSSAKPTSRLGPVREEICLDEIDKYYPFEDDYQTRTLDPSDAVFIRIP